MKTQQQIPQRIKNLKVLSLQLQKINLSNSNFLQSKIKPLKQFTKKQQTLNQKKNIKRQKTRQKLNQSYKKQQMSSSTFTILKEDINYCINNREKQLNQLNLLNEQKNQLQYAIKKFEQQIRFQQEKLKKIQQQSWKQNLPFFNFTASVNMFVTKMHIYEKDYSKIDYKSYQLRIYFDSLLFKKINNSLKKELSLFDLKQVHYIEDIKMRIVFNQSNQQNTNCFLKFKQQKQLNEFDLALFINSKLAKEVNKVTNVLQNNSFHQLLQSSIGFNRSLDDKNNLRKQNHSKSHSNQSSDTKKTNIEQLLFKNIQKNPFIENRNVNQIERNSNKVKQFIVFEDALGNESEEESRQRQATSKFNQQINQAFEDNIENNVKKLFVKEQFQAEQKLKKITFIKQSLTKGYFFIKYSKDAFKQHPKKVWINIQIKQLCYADSQNITKFKIVLLKDIEKIEYKKIGDGFKKFKKIEEIKEENCCLITYKQNKKSKVLQFQSVDAFLMKQFTSNLLQFLTLLF